MLRLFDLDATMKLYSTPYRRGVIPDKILESNTCKLCNKYLTVTPISIHPDGGNICGRCLNMSASPHLFECDSPVMQERNIPYAILGYVNNHYFPCINRFEGCNILLSSQDIRNHEVFCKQQRTNCPVCCKYEGTGSQQINHFKVAHPLSYFEQSNFSFELRSNPAAYLVRIRDCLFFLYSKYEVDNKRVTLLVQFINKRLNEQNNVTFLSVLRRDGKGVDCRNFSSQKSRNHISNVCVIGDVDAAGTIYCNCLLDTVPLNIRLT